MSWRYANLPDSRIERLQQAPAFDDIVAQIVAGGSSACIHREPCHDTEGRHTRYVMTLNVQPPVFDAFFNGPTGYRAQYAQSAQQGRDAGARALRQLSMFFRPKNRAPGALDVSITASSAKIWLCEDGRELCPFCQGEWSNAWAEGQPQHILDTGWLQEGAEAHRAHQAPEGTRLKLIGAFVDAAACQYVAPHEGDVHEKLHTTGWI